MSNSIYCKYCHHTWKSGIEYDKHIRCCEYFYQQRRMPSQPEMTESGIPVPSMRQLYRCVQDLSYRLEKTEKELKKLRGEMNSRKKIEILLWLNNQSVMPQTTFEDWVHSIKASESDMLKCLDGSLIDGILSCLYFAVKSSKPGDTIPIRCFTQKPGVFYIYSGSDTDPKCEWQKMSSEQFLKLVHTISTSIRREFRIWNTTHLCKSSQSQEFDQNIMDKIPRYVKKLNSDIEKIIPEIRKSLFEKIQEKFEHPPELI